MTPVNRSTVWLRGALRRRGHEKSSAGVRAALYRLKAEGFVAAYRGKGKGSPILWRRA